MSYRIFLVLLLMVACTQPPKTSTSVLRYFPQDASVVLKIHDGDAFASEVKNTTFLNQLKSTSFYQGFRNTWDPLNFSQLKAGSTLAIYEEGRKNHAFLLNFSGDSIPLSLNESTSKKVETFSYENREIVHYQVNETSFYTTSIEGIHLLSSSQLLLENAVRSKGGNKVPATLEKLIQTADPTKSASLFLDLEHPTFLLNELKDVGALQLSAFADWAAFDFTTKQEALLLNGLAISTDSIPRFISLFKGTAALPDRSAAIFPQNTKALLGFSFNDFEQFQNNQKRFLDRTTPINADLQSIEEIGVAFLNNEKAVAIRLFEDTTFMEVLKEHHQGTTTYQGSEIWQLDNTNLLSEFLDPLVKNFESNFYTVFENTFVFASSQNTLQTIIGNLRSGFTYDSGAVYTAAKAQLGNESSMYFIAGTEGLQLFLEEHFNPEFAKDFASLKLQDLVFAAQLTADEEFAHFNVLTTTIKKTPTRNSVAPIYNLELESDLVINPQFVKNHRNNKYEIVVQDEDNYLYLISTEGKVVWKKQLEGTIRGKIHQVDLFKNGKLQLAFCTNNQFLVLDRNGEEVAPFNKSYDGGNLNGLAVFDYEKTRDYRFVVTQGTSVFMYNNKGAIVDGFTYKKTESPVIAPPKHFKIGKKDYLTFLLENGALKIRHRAGGDRIKVARSISFSENEVFLYKNKFSVTDKKGVLHQVDTKGKLSATNFNLSENHGMYATSKSLALMDDNVLNIKGKKVELDFGVYSAPKIFYINDKIYVAVTDLQNQKIHLYDSQAKPIPNFPVYGSSAIDLLDINGDSKLELVAKDQANSIIVYTLN